jgi:ornithine--oxo-acid transaminase
MSCRVAKTALEVIIDEGLAQNAERLGQRFRERIYSSIGSIAPVRGKGLLNAIVIEPRGGSGGAKAVCLELMRRGLLCKPTHENIIRFAPPLTITEAQLDEACELIVDVVEKEAGKSD